jgi:glycosyltransferase involved in cell wall biosynthesis
VEVASLPNGVDPDAWRPNAPLPEGDLTLVSVMRLARRKRPLPFLRMLRELRREAPEDLDFRVVIIGDGTERVSMEHFLRTNGMDDWVSLIGRLDRSEIREVFSRSHVYVAPAELESFGIAALEARCAGLPVVASSRGGVGEFIAHGVDGLLASSDTDMVQAMLTLLTHESLRRTMTAHNRAVTPTSTWDAVLDGSAQLYQLARSRVDGAVSPRTVMA